MGGLKLPPASAELEPIEEYEFVLQLRLAGHGPTLFAGPSKRLDLKPVRRLEFGSGAVAMRYEPRTFRRHEERLRMQILRIDHVQLAMPQGQENKARDFYFRLLGIPEVQKPAALAVRGGVWFQDGEVKVHLGIDAEFRPSRKAHPAFLVQGLEVLVRRLREAGVPVVEDELLPGYERVCVTDPFGNRLELMERTG